MAKSKAKIGEEDKVELYRDFFKTMLDFGYAPAFIGSELAYIARAIEQANDNQSDH